MLFVVRAGRSRDMRKSRPAAQLATAGMARKGPRDGGASPTYRPHRPLLDVRWPRSLYVSSFSTPFTAIFTNQNVCSVKGSSYGC
jgi:hypothetical protein